MSELRSKYPQAQAWTFVLPDTPPISRTSSCSSKSTAVEAHKHRDNKATSGRAAATTSNPHASSRASNEPMGACCSSNMDVTVAAAATTGPGRPRQSAGNKENTADKNQEVTVAPLFTSHTKSANSSQYAPPTTSTHLLSPDTAKAPIAAINLTAKNLDFSPSVSKARGSSIIDCSSVNSNGHQNNHTNGDPGICGTEGDGAMGVLDATSLISPEPSLPSSMSRGEDVAFEDMGLGEEGEAGGGAWLARSLSMLTGGESIDVSKIKQIPGLEECLHELLSDRARHLKAMETLTNQLRRREADAEKKAHEGKAIAARLELVEQEKASLEQRMRAGAEEHRTERGRWLAHKQELETRCIQLEGKDTQYRASLRKKDMDYNKLQDSMRRAVHKESRGAGARSIEATFELTPAFCTGDGRAPLGGLMNDQSRRQVEELERENASLRSLLVDLKADVAELRGYHDRHGDLVSAGRTVATGDWEDDTAVNPVTERAIEGMPSDWLQRRLGDETARQVLVMRGALMRVLGEGRFAEESAVMKDANVVDHGRYTDVMAQLKEARSLLREQDVIMLAAIFDRPGAESAISTGRERCVCGAGSDPDGTVGSIIWDTRERLDQEREELEHERARLEQDKAKFLEEAVRRDRKSFVYSVPPSTPGSPLDSRGAGSSGWGGDVKVSTPVNWHRHLATTGTLMVPTTPCHAGVEEASCLPLMTFTPPGASPETTRLLGELGINPGNASPYREV